MKTTTRTILGLGAALLASLASADIGIVMPDTAYVGGSVNVTVTGKANKCNYAEGDAGKIRTATLNCKGGFQAAVYTWPSDDKGFTLNIGGESSFSFAIPKLKGPATECYLNLDIMYCDDQGSNRSLDVLSAVKNTASTIATATPAIAAGTATATVAATGTVAAPCQRRPLLLRPLRPRLPTRQR